MTYMKNIIIISLLAAILLSGASLKAQGSNSEYLKQLERIYGNDEYREMKEKFDSFEQSIAQHEEEERKSRNWRILISVIVGLLPAAVVLIRVFTGKIKPAGGRAVIQASFILLLGGAVLGAVNYLILWLRHTGNQAIFIYVVFIALVAGAIYLYTKKNPEKPEESKITKEPEKTEKPEERRTL